MRKIIGALAAAVTIGMAGQAGAADLPAKAPIFKAPPAPIVFNWTGFYIGAHGGGGWSETSWCRNGGFVDGCAGQVGGENFAQVDPDGFLGGVQAGYNWQIGQFVLGVEGEFSFADLTGEAPFRTFNSTYVAHTDVKDVATIAGRFGVAFDRILLYGKAGVAWANNDHWIVDTTNAVTYGTTNTTRTGWLVGAGFEYAFAGNWSAKAEYNFMDFGDNTYSIAGSGGGGGTSTVTIDQNIHVVKAGINYRFGGPY